MNNDTRTDSVSIIFKKKYEKAGILKEFRRRQFFVKPSVEKKMNKERAIRKSKRIVEEENT